jgi:DNA polymerase I-like protein with 3'-5' exonuclease and polymerase domains
MFVSPCVIEPEIDTKRCSIPGMLRSSGGCVFVRCLSRAFFQDADWYYTSIIKHLPEDGKPKAADYRWATPAFLDEIERMRPQLRIIVCLGKPALDFILALNPDPKERRTKYRLKDVNGAFLPASWIGPGVRLFAMDATRVPVVRPELYERFLLDLTAVKAELDATRGHSVIQVPQEYVTISKASELFNVMAHLKNQGVKELAVDCEWHGQTAWGGRLRSMQFCWGAGQAAYLRLMDDKLKYAFDRPREVVRQILAPVFNHPQMRFIGHNASADMPWMYHHLGINVYQKFTFDTMYAQHTVNEYADQKLERLAIRYTDLGRYDFELQQWKKSHGFDDKVDEGYGNVPDGILIPYACKDVDTTFRCRVPLQRELEKQKLTEYYNSFVLPFVTDGFYELMDTGLPLNVEFLTDMRSVFRRNRRILFDQFRRALTVEADKLLARLLHRWNPDRGVTMFMELQQLLRQAVDDQGHFQRKHPAVEAARRLAQGLFDYSTWEQFVNLFEHRLDAPVFNLNSVIQRKRWLFQVRKLKPIKTTKRAGVQIPWSKVTDLPKSQQGDYEPATDKDTVRVYANNDPMVAQFQELRAVDTILKSFLGGTHEEDADAVPNPDTPGAAEDDLEGKREPGLHGWIQEDERIHANFSLTETARPRTWKPNILNWPKSVTLPIEAAFARVQATNPEHKDKPSSLRACVEAPPGCVIIDTDLKTAEIVALARYANDQNMIRVLTEPDVQFARIDRENPKKVVRLCYNENEGIPESEWDQSLLVSPGDPRILRHPDGSIMHPKRDLHWEMGTAVMGRPREKCDERMVRDGCGKVGNFSIPYGASPSLLERLIEANTGIKPPAGTGWTMIDTWSNRYPACTQFLNEMEAVVAEPGRWRSLSGRIRHFNLGDAELRMDSLEEGVPHLLRQARNFPEQELVAATTGRALLRFIEERRRLGLRARIGVLLYDAMTAFAPLEEAKQTADLLRNCLTTWNQWDAPGGRFNFEVDVNFYFRWGVKMNAEERAILDQHLGTT